jgi:preprotein translocase subunit SecF
MTFLRFIPETTNIDFVRYRYFAFAADGLLLLVSIVSIWMYGFNLGIDFAGGVELTFKSAHTIDVGTVRNEIQGLKFNETEIQILGNGQCDIPVNSCVQIRVQPRGDQAADQVAGSIQAKLGPSFSMRSKNVIGPKVSAELFRDGILATVLAIICIAGYVAVRFEWQYGIGALIATGHDVFVTAGMYSVLHLNFSINSVAALLLLAGYSINDTVVVFDRIRENRRKYKRMPLRDRNPHDIGVRRHVPVRLSPGDLGRTGPVRFLRGDPVRYFCGHVLVDLCGGGSPSLPAARGRRPGRRSGDCAVG